MKKKRLVIHNKVRSKDIGSRHDTSGSPYLNWLASKESAEPTFANPNTLADTPANRAWGSQFSPQLAELIIEKFSDGYGSFPILSKRQNQVLKLTLLGLTTVDIAKELDIDQRNVVTYLSRIRSKFQRLLKTLDL